jgi:hypothetical protein
MKKGLFLLSTFFCIASAQSQVLISLIFGDKLNSPFLEFGLDGGLNFSTISNLETSGTEMGFNLGFYFDIKSKKNPAWMINTGVIVKSPMGAHGYLKAGPQAGLLAKAFDKFKNEYNKEDVVYKYNIRDKLHVIDAGIAVGAGYHMNVGNGLNITVQYYYGLVPLMKGDSSPDQYNRSLYVTAGIPIGKGKAAKKRAKEEEEKYKVILPESPK